MRRVAPLLCALSLLGCPSPSPGPDGGPTPPSNVCPNEKSETVAEGPVVACEQLFPTAPFLHLPEDTATLVYGGFKSTDTGPTFVTRSRSYDLKGALAWAWVERESTFGALRYAYFLYAATLDANGEVQNLTPMVRLDDRLFLGVLAGKTLEGGASERIAGDGGVTFTLEAHDAGLRIALDPQLASSAFDSVSGWPRYALFGTIENAHARVKASDGGCLAALDSLGTANLLFDADGGARVMLLRHPGMHSAFDDVFTLDWPEGVSGANNMGPGLYVAPVDFLSSTWPAPTDGSNHPHGVPWYGPGTTLTVVNGGGGTCN